MAQVEECPVWDSLPKHIRDQVFCFGSLSAVRHECNNWISCMPKPSLSGFVKLLNFANRIDRIGNRSFAHVGTYDALVAAG